MSSNSKSLPLTASLVLIATLLAGCSRGSLPVTSGQVAEADWADAYSTVAEMTQHAPVVAVGTVLGVAGSGQVNVVLPSGAPNPDTPYTEFTVSVKAALKGNPGTTIIVRQTGGRDSAGRTIELAGDPMLKTGETMLMFLREFSPGHFVIMGGPTGRYDISAQGRVIALPQSQIQSPPSTMAAFTSEVVSAAH